jgi:hypothetical protein
MVRAGAHLAAGAIAAALLLTGAGGAVAVADTPADSAASKNANGTAPDSSAAAAEHSVDNNTFSSSENARSAGEQADNAVASNGSDAKDPRVGSGDEQINEKKPDEKKPDHDPGTSDWPGDRRSMECRDVPEAPPVDLALLFQRRLASTWPRCPKRRLASTWPRCPKLLPPKRHRRPIYPPSFRPRPSTPTRWMRLPAKPDNVPAGMSHRS